MQPVPSGWHTLAGGAPGGGGALSGGDVVSGGGEVEVTGGARVPVTGGVEVTGETGVTVAGETESGAVGEVGARLDGDELTAGDVVLTIAGAEFSGDDGWSETDRTAVG